MPNHLSTLKEQKLREEYGDYYLRGILRSREAKPFEEFQGECAGSSWMKSTSIRSHRCEG